MPDEKEAERTYDAMLEIDEEYEPKVTAAEAEALKPIQKEFMESYLANRDKMPVEEWLREEMWRGLPERSEEEISEISAEIIATLKVQEEKKKSLERAVANGRSKESWLAGELRQATAHMSGQQAAEYAQNLDTALEKANSSLFRTITTQAGIVSRNPNLGGFIAEQYHAQTFNLNAEASGSPYRAKVLEPTGSVYGKNSVDIVIVDGDGKVVRRYQSKYCKDAEATAKAFGDNYRGQRKLVPDGQEGKVGKNATNVLEAPDGTKSKPLSKEGADKLQKEAQSGSWKELDWNEYKLKDVAVGIGKQAGQAALMGAAVGAGFEVANKLWNGEKIDGEEVVEKALTSGADFGVKAAAAGALKVGAEKGIIKCLQGTPAGTIANMANIAIENVKVLGRMADGQLTAKEGLEKMEEVSISTLGGIMASGKGMGIGAAVGSVLGPIGTAAGGLVGGAVGYMAGSKVGQAVAKGVKAIQNTAIKVVKTVGNAIKEKASAFADKVKSFFSVFASIFD